MQLCFHEYVGAIHLGNDLDVFQTQKAMGVYVVTYQNQNNTLEINMFQKKILSIITATLLCGSLAFADTEANGKGEAGASEPDAVAIAEDKALHKAVENLVELIMGPEALQQESITSKMDDIVEQVDVFKKKGEPKVSEKQGKVIVNYKLVVDDEKFRKVLKNKGISLSLTTSLKQARIMVIMDEVFTIPTDQNKPLEVTKKSFKDKSKSYDERENLDVKQKERDMASSDSRTQLDASSKSRSAGVVGYDNYYGSGGAAYASKNSASSGYKNSESAQAASSKDNSLNYGKSVNARANDVEITEETVKYQQRNTAADTDVSAAMQKMIDSLLKYSVTTVNSDSLVGDFFGDKFDTSMLTGSNLGRFLEKAQRSTEKAGFIAIGRTTIRDKGIQENNMYLCEGDSNVKIYSLPEKTNLASPNISARGTGTTADECRSKLSGNLGTLVGLEVGKTIQDNFRDNAHEGKVYTVQLVGDYDQSSVYEFKDIVERAANVKEINDEGGDIPSYSVTFRGGDLGEVIFKALIGADTFKGIKIARDKGSSTIKFCQNKGCK
ncbi:MAG: hypothetical protein WCW84_07080 [Sulfurimonas sp.]|jgi:hypothetical protein